MTGPADRACVGLPLYSSLRADGEVVVAACTDIPTADQTDRSNAAAAFSTNRHEMLCVGYHERSASRTRAEQNFRRRGKLDLF